MALLRETQPVWRVPGPSDEIFSGAIDETRRNPGLDDDYGLGLPDELPVGQWGMSERSQRPTGRTIGRLANCA